MTTLTGKNVLITGAASGLGTLLARKTAARGANVILWDVDHLGLSNVAAELRKDGHTVHHYPCDLGDREAIEMNAHKVREECGTIDVLINNAGIVSGKYLSELTDKEIENTFAVNVLAHFWTVRAFLPDMLEQNDGHVVTISSAGGILGAPRLTDYSASKFAVLGFDESLRLELRQLQANVRTTVVCPYYMNTGMFSGVTTRFSWLLPILAADDVASRIITAIEKDRARLVIPWFVYVTWPLRALPIAWFDRLARFLGITEGMNQFTGKSRR